MSTTLMMLLHGRDVLVQLQWNLSIRDTLTKGNIPNERDIELCTNLPLN